MKNHFVTPLENRKSDHGLFTMGDIQKHRIRYFSIFCHVFPKAIWGEKRNIEVYTENLIVDSCIVIDSTGACKILSFGNGSKIDHKFEKHPSSQASVR